jgi:hypothetical protein
VEKLCGDCGRPFQAKRLSAKFCSDLCRKRSQRRGKSPQPQQARQRDLQAGPGEPGPVERQVRADIAALVTAHPMGEAIAEMSYALARTLDAGAGMAVAAVNRELRANLIELSRLAIDDADELADELSAPEMPSEVRDSEES